MAKKKKFYVVWEGLQPGIYDSWTECQLQIKGYPNAKYKAFPTREEAEAAFYGRYENYTSEGAKKQAGAATPQTHPEIEWDSICVDAACEGNPGPMEYQGVDTRTGAQIFHKQFALGTNNIGEFLAIVHALAFFKQQNKDTPIYSDSRIAISWVRKKECRTQLKRTSQTKRLFKLIERAEDWLRNNSYSNPLLKWDTKDWGEIPADFGRK